MDIKFNYARIKRPENCLWCPVASSAGELAKFGPLLSPLFSACHLFLIALNWTIFLSSSSLFIIASSCFFQFLCYFIFILLLINSLCERATLEAVILVPRFTRHHQAYRHTFLLFPTFSFSTLSSVMSLLALLPTVRQASRQQQSLSHSPFIAAAVACFTNSALIALTIDLTWPSITTALNDCHFLL